MELYEEFLKTYPRDNNRFNDFINNNCPKISILEDLRAQGLPEGVARTECASCGLCRKNKFRASRNSLKKLIGELNSTPIYLLPGKLEGLSDKYLNIKLRVFETINRDYDSEISYYDNLYQYIIYSLILHFKQKLNEVGLDDIYFSQIAEILISTKAFVSDIERIRDTYLEVQTSSQNDFDFYRKPGIYKSSIYDEIVKIREKYLLSERWESWIEKMLYYDYKRNKKIIFRYIPSRRILRKMKIVRADGKTNLVNEPVIVGDETKKEIKAFQDAYHININHTPRKRKPISKPTFKKYLRWYKAREDGIRYGDIFDNELINHFEDWTEYRELQDGRNSLRRTLSDGRTEGQWVKTATDRMRYGVHKLKDRIFKEYK